MGILNIFSKKEFSRKPEDYKNVYLRWEMKGKEYGPMAFSEIPIRESRWTAPPVLIRFEGEDNWRKFKPLRKISLELLASEKQLKLLNKYNVSYNPETLRYSEARLLIETKVYELRDQEKKEKDQLPATKHSLKKLDALGITYSGEITRKQAKVLLLKHKEVESTKELLESLAKKGINVPEVFDLASISRDSKAEQDFISDLFTLETFIDEFGKTKIALALPMNMTAKLLSDVLEDLSTLEMALDSLEEYKISYTPPSPLDLSTIKKQAELLDNAFSELEEVAGQLEEKEIYTRSGDFRIVGTLPKAKTQDLLNEVFLEALDQKWNLERDIINLLEDHFPGIKLKELD